MNDKIVFSVFFPKDNDPKYKGSNDYKLRFSQAANEVLFYAANMPAQDITKLNEVMYDDDKMKPLYHNQQLLAKVMRMGIRLEMLMLILARADISVDNPTAFSAALKQDLDFFSDLIQDVNNINVGRPRQGEGGLSKSNENDEDALHFLFNLAYENYQKNSKNFQGDAVSFISNGYEVRR